MPGAGDSTQAAHHLLVDQQDAGHDDKEPEEPEPVVLSRLSVGRYAAGVIVGDQDDHARSRDRQKCSEPAAPRRPGTCIGGRNPAEGTDDVTPVCPVEQ
jgi:hypothetical protein